MWVSCWRNFEIPFRVSLYAQRNFNDLLGNFFGIWLKMCPRVLQKLHCAFKETMKGILNFLQLLELDTSSVFLSKCLWSVFFCMSTLMSPVLIAAICFGRSGWGTIDSLHASAAPSQMAPMSPTSATTNSAGPMALPLTCPSRESGGVTLCSTGVE